MADNRSIDRVDNNRQGWGAAAATCILALVVAIAAYSIHKATYRSPNDPMAGGLAAPSPSADH